MKPEKVEIEVRRMEPDETSQAAALHERELPHEFLTRFGAGFLSRYYRAFVESPYAVALTVRAGEAGGESPNGRSPEGGRLDGVLIGTFDTGAHYSYLVRRHGLALALATLGQLPRRPRLAMELLRTRLWRYLRGIFRSLGHAAGAGKDTGEEAKEERVGFVAYVAVDRKLRGRGLGGRLFGGFEELAREAGLRRLDLVTLPDERGAAPFFDSLGWKREGEITSRSGERYALFTRRLDD